MIAQQHSTSFAAPAKYALHVIELRLGRPFSGLGAAASALANHDSIPKPTKNKLRQLGTAESPDRHFTERGTDQWLTYLAQLCDSVAPQLSAAEEDGKSAALAPCSSALSYGEIDPLQLADPWDGVTLGLQPPWRSARVADPRATWSPSDGAASKPLLAIEKIGNETDAATAEFSALSLSVEKLTKDVESLALRVDGVASRGSDLDSIHAAVGEMMNSQRDTIVAILQHLESRLDRLEV